MLDDLVANGTITESQKTAILDGLDRRAHRAPGEAAQAQRQQLKEFLADGVITQEELDQLPADSPLRQLTGSWTTARSRPTSCAASVAASGFGGGRGHGFGKLFPKDGTAPDASPAPSESPASNS